MSKIQKAFEGKKAFIPFITCGDPDLETTEHLVYAMQQQVWIWTLFCQKHFLLSRYFHPNKYKFYTYFIQTLNSFN